jgi:4-amino-4-deoxy-L-arabinose transferase-like glycosyltransferase
LNKAIRAALLGGAAVLLGFAALSPSLYGSSGFPTARAAFFFSCGVALVAAGLTAGGPWGRAGRWAALALAGWAAHLQLIVAGPRPAYQHLDVLSASGSALLPLAVLVLEVVVVLWAAGRSGAWVLSRTGLRIPKLRVGLALAFLLGVAAVPSADPATYATESVLAFLLQLIHLCAAGVSVSAVPDPALARLGAWLDRDETSAFPRFAWGAAAFTTLLAAALCLWVYESHPHVPDELAYLLPARYFADLRLELALPPVAEAFSVDLIYNDGVRWYSPVPPGWPAVLAVGVLTGAPWLVNPVLGGISVLLAWRLTSSVYGPRTARLTTLLLASSPWLIFLSKSFMTHALTLACGLVAAVSVDEARRRNALWPTIVGGAALGLAALTRPLDAVAAAVVTGLWALTVRAGRFRFGAAVGLTLSSMAVGALTLPYNRHFTGSATTFPLNAFLEANYGPGTNDMGFGANRGLGWTGLDPFPGHGPVDVIVNAMLNGSAVNIELLGWSTGSLVLMALGMAAWRANRVDKAFLGMVVWVVLLHSAYWFAGGPDFGARYWFLTVVPLVVLTARGVGALDGLRGGSRVAALALGLSLVSVTAFVPWRALDKYHAYRGMDAGILSLAQEAGFGSDLVLVRGRRHPDYHSAAIYNPLDWDADATIYAWDSSPETRRAVLAAYPDRDVWVVEGPSSTGHGYRVVEGPVRPGPDRERLLR